MDFSHYPIIVNKWSPENSGVQKKCPITFSNSMTVLRVLTFSTRPVREA